MIRLIAEKIKQLRISQGLNQSDFARRLNITPGAVSQWETGRTVPDTERLMAIAKEFSVPLDYFTDAKYTETELIRQHIMIELGAAQPKTSEARILAQGVDKLPKEQREQALNVVKAMFAKYEKLFTEGDADETGL